MKIAILGSGLLGVSSAYVLASRGHEVTVIERQPQSGAETSYANGGQLSYTHAEPWANPAVWPKLPAWLTHTDSPLVFRPRADLAMMLWGLRFLRNCTAGRAREHCAAMLRLGLYSKKKLAEIRAATGILFDFNARGILHIFNTQQELDVARRHADFQAKFGATEKTLSAREVYALEPALEHSSRTLAGGMHAEMDENGDAFLYCRELARIATERHGAQFRYGVTITGIETDGVEISAVHTGESPVKADAYVMAMGSYSTLALRPLGIRVPVYPMKGYSITIAADEFCPSMSLTDGSHKIVYSRLGNRLRVAGTAEFAGYDSSISQRRIETIVRAAQILLPRANWNQDIQKWACLRPSTPDGPPLLGRTRYPNLFLNTGHGTLGWTQAAGSAYIVADLIENKIPEIMMHGLTMERL